MRFIYPGILLLLFGFCSSCSLIKEDPGWDDTPDYAKNFTIEERTEKPLLVADREWESLFVNYFSVLKRNGKFHMWYEAYSGGFTDDMSSNLCYAYSEDGVNWTKPELNIHSFNGSTENNILIKGSGSGGIHGPFVFEEEDTLRIIFKRNEAIYTATSVDGISWNNSRMLWEYASDTQTNVIREKTHYKIYVRFRHEERPIERLVGYSRTGSFKNPSFVSPFPILGATGRYRYDIYNPAVIKLKRDLYIALPSKFDYFDDTLIPSLAVSTNGINFKFAHNYNFIPLGEGFDSKMILVSPHAIYDDEKDGYWIYYLASKVGHNERIKYENRYLSSVGRFLLKVKGDL